MSNLCDEAEESTQEWSIGMVLQFVDFFITRKPWTRLERPARDKRSNLLEKLYITTGVVVKCRMGSMYDLK